MSGIANASEKMKKKLSLGNYPLSETNRAEAARKIYSLSKEDYQKLCSIVAKRAQLGNPSSISQIMSEAIHFLYNRETNVFG